jgi:hypothetical protein
MKKNKITNFTQEPESQEYQACRFELGSLKVVCRTAKITPTKVGQFVTIWKRNELGKTCPFDSTDDIDLVIINCKSGENIGHFAFPKAVLIAKGIISTPTKVGKMGIRVYPIWDKANNSQSIRTQKLQLEYWNEGGEFLIYIMKKNYNNC